MQTDDLYQSMLRKLEEHLEVLHDKPEETPSSTLRALWFSAADDARSAQAAETGVLPELNSGQSEKLKEFVNQRLQGTPLAHITRRQQFMGVELLAGPEALVPRKETELLGNSALDLIKKTNSDHGPSVVIDICTGSGNLAIAFAVYAPESRIYAADLSSDAINLAKRNAEFAGVTDRVEFREGDLLSPFEDDALLGAVDLLACNPPYISSSKVDALHEEIAGHEPRLAFDGGPFGINILRRLIREAPQYLKQGGWLAFEVGLGQGSAWKQRLESHNDFAEVRSTVDDAGEIRVILAQRA